MSTNVGVDIAIQIVADAEQIEREKAHKALLPHEVQTIQAANFLRKIAPYLFEAPKQ